MPRFPHFVYPLFLLSAIPARALDLDANLLPDVWEARYHASGLVPAEDTDGDGQSNAQEAIAGTNPFDGLSYLNATIENTPEGLALVFPTQAGKKYQLLVCATLDGEWLPTGVSHVATGTTHQFLASQSGTSGFFKVSVTDADSDSDGVDDWSELQLSGFNPQNGSSFPGASGNDLAIATEMVNAWRNAGISVAITAASAFEKENQPAVLTYTRSSAPAYPMTLFLKKSGATDPTKSSASETDYTIQDGAAQAVTGRLVIAAGASSAVLNVGPVTDTLIEVPEQLRIRVGGTPLDSIVDVRDATNIQANQRLMVAYLRPLTGVVSGGSGIGTARLTGDNDSAILTAAFSSLNSPVNSTQVLNAGSSILQSIPPANYGGQTWLIRASQSYLSDQAVLDSLLSGGVKLGIFTEAHVNGEIEGVFQPTVGSTQFQVPPPAAPIDPLTGDPLERDIIRFLTQATYGPTPQAIADMKTRVANAGGDRIAAYSAWIDQQFATTATSLLDYTIAANKQDIAAYAADPAKSYYTLTYDPNNANRRRGWWMLALNSPDQLRQRLAFALSEIFVVSDTNNVVYERSYGAAHYYDMLGIKGGGSYRSLLEGVSLHPIMGYYLSHLKNAKTTTTGGVTVSPDENYAREVMQLFSIGLVQLHPDGSLKLGPDGAPIPTYSQADISEMARVFTGLSFSKWNNPTNSDTVVDNTSFTRGNGNERYESQWMNPMKMFAPQHDTGAKAPLGLGIPANQTGEKDLSDVLNHLASHPSTAPFISRRLIQRLVSANPSSGYLYRVSSEFTATNGNLPAVVKKILIDPEARSQEDAQALAGAGKVREPILRTTAFLRAFGAKSQLPLSDLLAYGYPQAQLDLFPPGTTRARVAQTTTGPGSTANLGQSPLAAPSVFNWFSPEYSPSGLLSANGVVSPELQIANENSVITTTNYLYSPIYSTSTVNGVSVPLGINGMSNIVNQSDPPSSYAVNAHYLVTDYTPLEALYMAVVDINGDGSFTSLDTGAFNNTAKITEACTAVVNRVDLLLAAGGLKTKYGDTPGKPRKLILDAVVGIRSANNSTNTAAQQATNMRDRIKTALWLVMSSPECVIQK